MTVSASDANDLLRASLVDTALARYRILRHDPEAIAWGATLKEAVLEVLGCDAAPEAIAELEILVSEELARG